MIIMRNNSSNLKNILFILGVIFILFAILFNQFSWLAFFDTDGILSANTRACFFLVDVFFVAVGLLLILNKNNFKKFVFTSIAICLITISVEVALRISYYFIEDEKMDERYYLSPYKNKEWAYEYWEAQYDSWDITYEPFLGWNRREYHSKYINIDRFGVRKNFNPNISPDKLYEKLYVFGGSTTWGDGARDEFTIPSQLSKMLYQNGYNFQVSNYGERGYTFLQELIHLILLLKDGQRPDFVIFYDGVNDVYGAFQSGMAGTPHNVESMRNKLGLTEKEMLIHSITYITKLKWSMIQRATGKIFNLVFPQEMIFEEKAAKYTEEQLCQLAVDITKHYQKSIVLLDKLSNVYDFEYLCFWQPTLFTKKYSTTEEASAGVWRQDKSFGKLIKEVNAILNDKNIPKFYNISNIFDDMTTTFYIDFCHLSEEGNEVVAKEIFSKSEKEWLNK